MINKFYILLSLLAVILLLSACFEVSEGHLFEDFQPKVVITAELNNLNPPYYVYLNKTVAPNDSILSSPINNAVVILSGNKGQSELLRLTKPGVYESSTIIGKPGGEYSLRVNIDNDNYTAVELMAQPPNVHRIEIIYLDKFVQKDGYYLKLYIDKEIAETQFYKLEVKCNDSLYNAYSDLLIINDAYADNVLEYLVPYAFQLNDSVSINVNSVSERMALYYNELSKQTINSFSNIQPPMQNPPAGFTNSALGYFQVSSVTTLNVKIHN